MGSTDLPTLAAEAAKQAVEATVGADDPKTGRRLADAAAAAVLEESERVVRETRELNRYRERG